MGFLTRRLNLTLIASFYVLVLLAAPLLGLRTAYADGEVEIISGPLPVTADTTAVFTFDMLMGSETECRIDGGSFVPCTSPYTTPTLGTGSHTFRVHVVDEVNPEATAQYTWEINVLPAFSDAGEVRGAPTGPIAVSGLQVEDDGNETYTVKLSVPDGSLQLTTATGLTFTGSHPGTDLEFSGTRANLNAGLAALTYTPVGLGDTTLSAYILAANGMYDTFDAHVYKLVRTSLNWANAKAAAEASTYGGAPGYLATIASSGENDFITDRLPGNSAWIGANDIAAEGDWQWAGGAEDGQSFWSGDSSGSAVGGAFTAWQGGMPDDFGGGEDCLEIYPNPVNVWNDQNCSSGRYYMVEYGDGSHTPYIASTELTIVATTDTDGDGLDDDNEAAAPNTGDANNDGTPDGQQANVTGQLSHVSDSYVVTQTNCTANINVQLGAEASTPHDAGYDYPYGLVDFTSTGCGAAGGTVTVTQYYYGVADPDEFVVRKWDGGYATIPGAVLSAVTIGGQAAVKVVYQIVDGGPLDQDGAADGNVRDPVGLGVSTVGAPNTGLGGLDIF